MTFITCHCILHFSYFINHATRQTTWVDPRTTAPQQQAGWSGAQQTAQQSQQPSTSGQRQHTQQEESIALRNLSSGGSQVFLTNIVFKMHITHLLKSKDLTTVTCQRIFKWGYSRRNLPTDYQIFQNYIQVMITAPDFINKPSDTDSVCKSGGVIPPTLQLWHVPV